jgi:hypothetical protein
MAAREGTLPTWHRGVIEYGAGGSDVVGTLVLMMLMVKRGHRLHHHHPTGSG